MIGQVSTFIPASAAQTEVTGNFGERIFYPNNYGGIVLNFRSDGTFSVRILDDGRVQGEGLLQRTFTASGPCNVEKSDSQIVHISGKADLTSKRVTLEFTTDDSSRSTYQCGDIRGEIFAPAFRFATNIKMKEGYPPPPIFNLSLEAGARYEDPHNQPCEPSDTCRIWIEIGQSSGTIPGQGVFDFSISTSNVVLRVAPGNSVQTQVSIHLEKGTAKPVTLKLGTNDRRILDLVMGRLTKVTDNPPFLSDLTLIASPDTPKGTYNIAIIAEGGGVSHHIIIKLIVEENKEYTPPSPPLPSPPTTEESKKVGTLRVDQTRVIIPKSQPIQVNVYGKANEPRGGKVVLTISKPDRTFEEVEAIVTSKGDFSFPIILDKSSQIGRYEIRASYQDSYLGSVSFDIVSTDALPAQPCQFAIKASPFFNGYVEQGHSISFNNPPYSFRVKWPASCEDPRASGHLTWQVSGPLVAKIGKTSSVPASSSGREALGPNLNIEVPKTANTGPYTFTVTGTDERGISASIDVTVVVQPRGASTLDKPSLPVSPSTPQPPLQVQVPTPTKTTPKAPTVIKEKEPSPSSLLSPMGKVKVVQGNVEITNVSSGTKSKLTAGGEIGVGDVVHTGSDPNTIVGIFSKDGTVELWKDTKATFLGLEQRTNADGTKGLRIVPPPMPYPKHVQCNDYLCDFKDEGIINLDLGPARLALPAILALVESTPQARILFLFEGAVYLNEVAMEAAKEAGEELGKEIAKETTFKKLPIDAIVTNNAVVMPNGTELIVEVDKSGATKVMVLQDVVEVHDRLGTYPKTVVEANQYVYRSSELDKKGSFDPNTIDRWWIAEAQPGQPQQTGKGGGCLIATATYGSELAPQVQQLRETRDKVLFHTQSGTTFVNAFDQFYYTFSPTIADWERQNPIFKEAVKITITPLITTLSILNYLDINSEAQMIGYGIGVILLNIGMYFGAPAFVIMKIRRISC